LTTGGVRYARGLRKAQVYFPWLELSPAIPRGFFSKAEKRPQEGFLRISPHPDSLYTRARRRQYVTAPQLEHRVPAQRRGGGHRNWQA
jgi:hypothetical protein